MIQVMKKIKSMVCMRLVDGIFMLRIFNLYILAQNDTKTKKAKAFNRYSF